jgi:DNA-binding beta-propeller fold protein YncE
MHGMTSPIRHERYVLGMGLIALVLLPGLAFGGGKKKLVAQKSPTLVWPLPPEKPRIKFVAAIYGAADVEPVKKAGFLDRLAGIEQREFKPTFIKPYGIATDSHNRIYVTDSGQGLVFIFDRDNKKVSYLGRGPQVRLRVPIGIAVDAQDRVWVADAVGEHVYAFDAEGTVLMALGRQGEMENPTSVAVDDARHRIYVVDSRQHQVLVYDTESGQLLFKFGERGSGDGQFNYPTNIARDREGRLYVTDTMNFRVEVFSPEGKFLETWGTQGNRFGEFLKPKGVALDSFQNIYIVDSDFDNLQIFDQQKRLLLYLGGMGRAPGTFWLPAGIHIDRNNRIYVADQNNRRIQIFQLLDGAASEPPASTAIARASSQENHENRGGEKGVTKDSAGNQ